MTPPPPHLDPVSDAADLPWPGEELVHRVTGATDREHFYTTGRQSVRDLEAVLSLVHRRLSDYGTILDFGCGCGRIMLWLEHLSATSSLHGVDIDERAIQWSRDHMPWATFKVNQPAPPLEYPDAFFELVFNHSVFTHIDEDLQDRWLAELRRVVKPGGHLILSVHGEAAFRVVEADSRRTGVGDPRPIRRELSTKGIHHSRDDIFTGGPFPDCYHSTFHAPWYVFQHWGRYLTIEAYVPRGSMGFQDFVLLRRPSDDADDAEAGEPITVDVAAGSGERGATGAPPAAPAWTDRWADAAEDALHRAGDLLHQGYDATRGEQGPRATARQLVERAIRSRSEYQRQVDEALFTALFQLRSYVDRRTTGPGGKPVSEIYTRLWDAVRLQGERINRLEADLWEAIRSLPSGGPSPPTSVAPGPG